MTPTLTWLDLTATDRDRMRRVLDLFTEQGTVDEMGLGSLRDALSSELFPGTSSIQTRLRYALFVPWIYRNLEARRVPSSEVAREARAAELFLIAPLAEATDSEGVIGARARASLSRLPSSVYWAALVRWGIFRHPQSQSWYHTHLTRLARGRDELGRADDPGVVWTREPTWHERLPAPPASFPAEVSFELTFEEADFLRGRLEETCKGSLLAWLAREGSSSPADTFWYDPDAKRAGPAIAETVELARRFSLHVEGAPLLYNLLLAERREAEPASERERDDRSDDHRERYREQLAEWADREAADPPFEPPQMWHFVARRGGRLPDRQRRFVEHWARRVAEIGPGAVVDDADLRRLVEQREIELKGGRARLLNRGRLLDWSGQAGVGRMDFRWFRVRQLVADLHRGLAT
ncbi:MAG: DUF6361 family protein [Nannocystaceae bacterium]